MAAWLLPLAIQPASIKTPYTHTHPEQNPEFIGFWAAFFTCSGK